MKVRHIIFIHGWASGPYVWLHQASYFKDKCGVHTPQLAGYGKKRLPKSEDMFKVMADDINSFISKNSLDEICLVGWSLGGMVSLKVASILKGKVSRLVLVGTTARFTKSHDFQHAVSREIVEKIHGRMKTDFQATLDWFYKFCFSSHERSRNEFSEVMKLLGDFIEPLDEDALLAGLELLMELDVRSLLGDISAPTLLIHGGQDRICPPTAIDYLKSRIKNSRSALIEDAGHAPFLTEPARVNKLIEEFLSK